MCPVAVGGTHCSAECDHSARALCFSSHTSQKTRNVTVATLWAAARHLRVTRSPENPEQRSGTSLASDQRPFRLGWGAKMSADRPALVTPVTVGKIDLHLKMIWDHGPGF
jgi:hypothetical protein